MHGIRFVIGRPRGSSSTAIQSIVFDANAWTDADARSWLFRQGFKPRNLDKSGRLLRYRLREQKDFEPRSFRTISTGRREKVTMSSNSRKKRGSGKRRRAKQRTKRNPTAKRRAKPKRTKPAKRSNGKTVRTIVKSVKVTKQNPRKKKSRKKKRAAAPRTKKNPSTRYTIAFAPSAARTFAKVARLSVQHRREMLKALRRHPSGGVYVAAPAWHGTRDQAQRLADRVQTILAYAAGRRRASLTSASVPRVIAVP